MSSSGKWAMEEENSGASKTLFEGKRGPSRWPHIRTGTAVQRIGKLKVHSTGSKKKSDHLS